MTVGRCNPGRKKAIVAALFDHFTGLTMDGFSRLTDKQIQEIFFHARKKDGTIDFPMEFVLVPKQAEEETLEKALKDLEMMLTVFGSLMDKDSVEKAKEALKEKYSARNT